MKSILTLMVTIFIYSLSFAQNSNDCNITPNDADFKNFIADDNNKNVKMLNSFISMKKNQRDELKLLQPSENKQSESTYETDYDKFKKNRLIITEFKYPLSGDTIDISEKQYNALKELKFLITQNIDIHKENSEDKRIENIKKGFENYKNLNFQIKEPSQESNQTEYIVNKTAFEQFLGSLDYIKMTDFNTCQLIIKKNLDNIYADINDAEIYLNNLSSKELTEFSFKKHIMVIVGALIAIILVCFFTGVLYKATDAVKQKLIGETGLQFITIFVIIIAVILFGVMNILKGSELAAILSAIAGYILGKTAPPKSDKTLEIELEILRLKSQEAERIKQEEADKKVAEAAEALKKQEEEKRKLEIEAENKKLESEEIQGDIEPDTATISITEEVNQEPEILTEDTDENLANSNEHTTNKSDESDESNEGVDLDQSRDK